MKVVLRVEQCVGKWRNIIVSRIVSSKVSEQNRTNEVVIKKRAHKPKLPQGIITTSTVVRARYPIPVVGCIMVPIPLKKIPGLGPGASGGGRPADGFPRSPHVLNVTLCMAVVCVPGPRYRRMSQGCASLHAILSNLPQEKSKKSYKNK